LASITEGNGSGYTTVEFDVTAYGITQTEIVNWTVISDANSDVSANDFSGSPLSGVLTFTSDGTQKISFSLLQDSNVEFAEGLTVRISSESDIVKVSEATVNITDDDVITESADSIFGTSSDDVIDGLSGNDFIFGYEGNDALYGGDGDDALYGGAGHDVLVGGDGADRFIFEASDHGIDIVSDFESGIDLVAISSAGFNGFNPQVVIKQAFDTDIQTTLDALFGQGDGDVYIANFDSEVSASQIEAAAHNSSHTGSAFFLVSDGVDTKLYYDEDTGSGDDGSGIDLIAEFNDVTDATLMIDDISVQQ
jgi:Ca2+-binding RTX toxin-like protein